MAADPDYSRVTFVFAMPRSRSQWLTWVMSVNGITTWHDPLGQCTSPTDLLRKVRAHLWNTEGPLVIVDTGAIFFQRNLRLLMPAMKRAFLFRNPEDSAQSVHRQTRQNKIALMRETNERMMKHAFDENTFRMYFGLIDQAMPAFWHFVTGQTMPPEVAKRCNECSGKKIDVPLFMQVPTDLYKAKQLLRHKEEYE